MQKVLRDSGRLDSGAYKIRCAGATLVSLVFQGTKRLIIRLHTMLIIC